MGYRRHSHYITQKNITSINIMYHNQYNRSYLPKKNKTVFAFRLGNYELRATLMMRYKNTHQKASHSVS